MNRKISSQIFSDKLIKFHCVFLPLVVLNQMPHITGFVQLWSEIFSSTYTTVIGISHCILQSIWERHFANSLFCFCVCVCVSMVFLINLVAGIVSLLVIVWLAPGFPMRSASSNKSFVFFGSFFNNKIHHFLFWKALLGSCLGKTHAGHCALKVKQKL